MKKRKINPISLKRAKIQWALLPIFLIAASLGWKYHWLGFVVPVAMIVGMVGGLLRGRYVCGNLCPRGAFLDRLLAKISPKREIPSFFRSSYLRAFMFAFLIGMLTFQISRDPGNIMHWGFSFWLICFVTSILAIILGIFFHHRTWCAFCPIGSFGALFGGHKRALAIEREKCVNCLLCEKVCPMTLKIASKNSNDLICNRDCIQCQECVGHCPKKILSLVKNPQGKESCAEESLPQAALQR
ncbi:hypothetical protein Thein_0843 [Thermodesulfatator indicus DSM 15286]|uniref:4Fe-4S ferredoxin-type domain-containing protein n=1 Tax=Thermodesulfatator indicus (strain DSM 15286 / JCM 11887 / CIR29812) TaxID=667014 RepID=F8ACS9_THEID|nr:4Fe-4S binding protein [Thermodesulfatator indicus]AEH44720.1 hypothetical protein Thein_0843 [Thermodesulfatator indicus DSM 15286]